MKYLMILNIFSYLLVILNIFSYLWPSVSPLWRSFYAGPLPIKKIFLVLSCKMFLYILDINPLSNVSLANTFCHSLGCFFILLKVFFAVSYLFIFSLFPCPKEIYHKKVLLWEMSEILLAMFSYRIFMVFRKTFKSLMNFEFFSCVWCKKMV